MQKADFEKTWIVGIVVLICALAPALAAGGDDGVYLTGGSPTNPNRSLNDGAGYRWDTNVLGMVNDGSNDAYDGGMRLQVNGNQFQSPSNQGLPSKDGREIQVGPWTHNNVAIHRRLYVDAKIGYARWVDIFQNTSSSKQTITLEYYSNLGGSIQQTRTTTGQAMPGKKDWGLVTGNPQDTSRPNLVHFFASKSSKIRPTVSFQTGGDDFRYRMSLTIPANKTVALCFFEIQRSGYGEAIKLLKTFSIEKELAKLSRPLRKLLVNMSGSTLVIGGLELLRSEEHDRIVLQNQNELLGMIQNSQFDIETFWGRLTLPAGRVLGLHVPSADGSAVHLALADGQILVGALHSEPIVLRLANGEELSLPIWQLQTVAYRVSPEKPEELTLRRPLLVLRSGQQVCFPPEALPGEFQTEYGTVRLQAEHLRSIQLDTPDGGLHRAVFRNGSVLSGLLTAGELSLALDLGAHLKIPLASVRQFLLPAGSEPKADALTQVTLRNENVLRGRLLAETLPLRTDLSDVEVVVANIRRIQRVEGAFGRFAVHLHAGSTITGELLQDTLRFEIAPGLELNLYAGHIDHVVRPQPPSAIKPESKPKSESNEAVIETRENPRIELETTNPERLAE